MTNVLTDEEIDAVAEAHPYNISLYTRAIEAAVVKRLAAGVRVEPAAERRRIRYSWGECWDYRDDEKVAYTAPGFDITLVTPAAPLFTLDQLTTAIAAARVQENERCAKVCESTSWSEDIDVWREMTKRDVSVKSMLACAEAIRASIGETK